MSNPSPDNWNKQIIEEFRANNGKVGGPFTGATIVLLHTIGAKSGQPRINPLASFKDGDNIVIAASKAGAPSNPDWYYNILAHPDVTLEIGTETFKAQATVIAEGEERDRIYANIVKQAPGFGEYQKNTTRIIPVVLLKRI